MSRKVLVSLALLAVIILAASGGQTRPRTAVAASFAVSTTDDSGPGSLRRAVSDANAAPGPDTITFAIPGAGPHVISLLGAINIQDEGTTIDASGTSIIVDGSSAPSPSNLFQVAASSVTFIGFTVRNAPSNGITVSPAFSGACAGSITSVLLRRMTLSGNGENGLLICATSGGQAFVSDSEFLGNATGITASGAIAGNVHGAGSRFVGNGLAVHVQGPVTGSFDARNNWWGCPTGANTPGCDTTHAAVDTSNHLTVDTFRVTNVHDSGEGSLRRAINDANSRPGHDVIRFDVSGTIALTGGNFPVTDNVEIDGGGQSIIIDGAAMPAPSNIFESTAAYFVLANVSLKNADRNAVSVGGLACPSDVSAVFDHVRFENSGESGLVICGSGSIGVQVAESAFVGNANGITVVGGTNASGIQVLESSFVETSGFAVYNESATGTVQAEDNWWGCNAGANGTDAGCQATYGAVDSDPWVADYLVVTSLAELGAGSLREAISQANADPGDNTISFAVNGVIALGSALSLTDDGTTIDGTGRDLTLSWTANGQFLLPASHTTLRHLNLQNVNIGIYPGGGCNGSIEALVLDDIIAVAPTPSLAQPQTQNVSLCAASATNISVLNSDFSGASGKGIQLSRGASPDPFSLTGLTVANTRVVSGRTAISVGIGDAGHPVSFTDVEITASDLRAIGTSGPRQGFDTSGASVSATNFAITSSNLVGGAVIITAGSLTGDGLAISENTIAGAVSIQSQAATGTVSGVTISGNTIAAIGAPGVYINANSIEDVAISANPLIESTGSNGVSVQAKSTVPSSISRIDISDNGLIRGIHGVLVGASGNATITISNVSIDRNGTITGADASGISVFGLGGTTISGVSINQNGAIVGGGTRAIGIGSVTASAVISDVSISDNDSLSGFNAGINVGNEAATASNSGLVITGNGLITASGPGAPAVQILSGNPGAGNVVSANGIADSGVGVRVANGVPGVPTGLTIVGNVIENTGTGVRVESSAGSGIVVRLNNFLENNLGIESFDAVTAIDAVQNWWGCDAGPAGTGCDALSVTPPGSIVFTPWLEAPTNVVRTSPAASGGESAAVAGAPTSSGQSGAAATIQTTGTTPATVTVSSYLSNPATTIFDVGGGFVDVFLNEPASVTSVATVFYYPATVTGTVEASLVLWYFDGESWLEVRGSGGAVPVKDTTDNLDGTVSGGRFQLVFDSTSTPTAGELNGTILTFTSLPPSIEKTKLTDGKKVGKKVKLSATFEDPTPAAVYLATIDWGDGTVTSGEVELKLNHEVAQVTVKKEDHVYGAPGDYTVTLTLQADGRTLVVAMGTVEVRS